MIANIYNRAVMEEVYYEIIVRTMVFVLSDGLSYGNWPWAVWTHGRDDQEVIENEARIKPDVQKMSKIMREARLPKG
jgi:hypothetical protein